MQDNKGIIYENKINRMLKNVKLQSRSFKGAGSDINGPDSEIKINGKKYYIELKLGLVVDFGQGSLDYDFKKKKWVLSGADKHMKEFLSKIEVPKMVNKVWGSEGAPRRYSIPLDNFKKADADFDYAHFTSQYVTVPSDAVSNYYASKNIYYIQIGNGYGLYHMDKDPAGLGVPQFKPDLKLRIRLKRNAAYPIYNYRFTTALQVKRLLKSTLNIENPNDLIAMAARSE